MVDDFQCNKKYHPNAAQMIEFKFLAISNK
jgi:hypothetical protein